MRRWQTLTIYAAAWGLAASPGYAADDGWTPLFDGKSLRGWSRVNGSAPFVSRDGAIVGTTVTDSPNSFLATDRTYRDFVLEFEVRQDGGPANSGVQIRSARDPQYNEGRVFGYQIDIDPSVRDWSGMVYDEQRRGWLYPGPLNPSARGVYRMGEWNRFRIEAVGTTIRTWLNDIPVAHLIDAAARDGFIALQIHSIDRPEEAGRTTAWRNIRIRETAQTSEPIGTLFVRNLLANDLSPIEREQGWSLLWDGRTRHGWRSVAAAGQEWAIEDGELTLRAGGHIVTDAAFAAFDLQFEFLLTPGAAGGVAYFVSDAAQADIPRLEYRLRDEASPANSDATNTLASLANLLARGPLLTNLGIAPRVGEWQHGRIVAHFDQRIEHWLNGTKVLEYVRTAPAFGHAARGRISLRVGDNEIRFRSIKIRAL
jgi:hypothetical protein